MKRLALLLLVICAKAQAMNPMVQGAYPLCFPTAPYLNQAWGVVDPGVSTTHHNWTAWVCETPVGFFTEVTLVNFTTDVTDLVALYQKGQWTLAQAQADCAKTCGQPTDAETAYIALLTAKYKPIAIVAFNGGKPTRQVYTSPDAVVLGPPVANVQVPVGTPCMENTRVVGSGKTGYFSVIGQKDSTGNVLGDVYALCTLSFPIGYN